MRWISLPLNQIRFAPLPFDGNLTPSQLHTARFLAPDLPETATTADVRAHPEFQLELLDAAVQGRVPAAPDSSQELFEVPTLLASFLVEVF
jgi:hypothetical protein